MSVRSRQSMPRSAATRPLAVMMLLALGAVGCPSRSAERNPATHRASGVETQEPSIVLPGAPALDATLSQRLRAAAKAHPAGGGPQTGGAQVSADPKYINRLVLESSPYLLLHAYNPVNWFPWGDEAFEAARRLGRPIFLSVGYSTCHWCHVMEEESFEDEEIARAINENYIPIKVDREERPDIDGIYMAAVQALTGGGGWPMTVWLTPDRKPFAGGTYFPARDGDRGARVGLLTLVRERARFFREQPDRVAAVADGLARRMHRELGSAPSAGLSQDVSWGPSPGPLLDAAHAYAARFDAVNGGLAGAPKFPSSLPIRFLFHHYRRTGDKASLRMALLTLEKIAAGGIHDRVGGGFHRYSTDARWLIPHFEKMLYDNALLAMAYVEAFQVTGREDFAAIARETLRYVERDMTSPSGGFYSATDADSRGPDGRLSEGRFFTWTPAEIEDAVGAEPAHLVEAYFGVSAAGNLDGRSVLSTPRPARELGLSSDRAPAMIDRATEALNAARSIRPAPFRDEKIVASWNGLMISAYARAALAFDDERDALLARRAADFVLTQMRDGSRLMHSSTGGHVSTRGYLDDYAFMIAGLLDLYEATSEVRWLREAVALDTVLRDGFEDARDGSYFMTASDAEALLAREKPSYDGAEPSGTSVEVLNLLRLHAMTSRDEYRARAERTLRGFEDRLSREPTALSEMLLAVDFATDRAKEIVIVCPRSLGDAEPLLASLRATYLPNRVLTRVVAGDDAKEHVLLQPSVDGKVARGGRATAYVCEGQSCQLPTSDPAVFAAELLPAHELRK